MTGLSIAGAARHSGLSVYTLRFYESAGLLVHRVARDSTGRRRYSPDDLAWIDICAKMRATGMPIAELRRYAALVRAGSGNEDERLAVLQRHRERVLAAQAELAENLRLIDYKVDTYRARYAAGQAAGLWSVTGPGDDR